MSVPIVLIGIFVLVRIYVVQGDIYAIHRDINSRVDELIAIANRERYAAGREDERLDTVERDALRGIEREDERGERH